MIEHAVVPPQVRERLTVRFGPQVSAWCDRLPSLVEELAARWGLDVLAARGGGTSRVFRCLRRAGGTVVWLKLTPDRGIAAEEAEALRAWSATGAVVGLLAKDEAAGALLLRDVAPGLPAAQAPWRLEDAAALLRDLRGARPVRRPDSALRPLAHRVAFLFDLAARRLDAAGLAASSGARLLDRARGPALELAGTGPTALVHGDLHTANVLIGPGNRLVAIDPRPAWGDPDFDAADWALAAATDPARLEERIAVLARLVPGLSARRLALWCRTAAALTAASRSCTGQDDPETRFLAELAGG